MEWNLGSNAELVICSDFSMILNMALSIGHLTTVTLRI